MQKIYYGFLADDDIIYKLRWARLYISYIINTDIQHFVYWPKFINSL